MDTCLQREHVREGVVEEVVARRDAVIAQGDGTELPRDPSSFIHHFIQMKLSIGGCLRRRLELDRIERLVRDADARGADRVAPHLEHPPVGSLCTFFDSVCTFFDSL